MSEVPVRDRAAVSQAVADCRDGKRLRRGVRRNRVCSLDAPGGQRGVYRTARPRGASTLELRPVIWTGRRKFFELAGPEGPLFVAVAGMKASGWRCDACDYRTWGYWNEELQIRNFVARSDVPLGASVFTVGRYPEVRLAVSAHSGRSIGGAQGNAGVHEQPAGAGPNR